MSLQLAARLVFAADELAKAPRYAAAIPQRDEVLDARVGALVNDLIGQVADKWTMLILEVLTEDGEQRFTRLGGWVGSISQKMLTRTLRQMEREGLVTQTVHAVVPPRGDYRLTGLGLSLSASFCSDWLWAAENLDEVEHARQQFDTRTGKAAR